MTTPTAIYSAVMLEIERRRQQVGVGMEKFSEFAGVPERYYSKALHADEPSGRQAQWPTVQRIVEALFPHGFDLIIKAKPGPLFEPINLKAKLLGLRAMTDKLSQREYMTNLSVQAAAARKKKIPAHRRKQIAKKAAKARWSKPNVVEILDAKIAESQAEEIKRREQKAASAIPSPAKRRASSRD